MMDKYNDYDVLVETLKEKDTNKRIHALRSQVEKGRDINSRGSYGQSVLQAAARGGHVECVRFLIEAGADVKGANDYGERSLMKATCYGHIECMRLLLKAGANANGVSKIVKHTILMEAASFGRVDCVQLLLEYGANIHDADTSVKTALTAAAYKGNVECVRVLLQAGANVDHVNKKGKTALMEAAMMGNIECVRVLLEAGANVNAVDIYLNTALIHCVMFNSCRTTAPIKTLKLLVKAGADIDAQDDEQVQPIHLALRLWSKCKLPAKYLISENCNLAYASYDKIWAKNFKEKDRLVILRLLFACGLPRHLCQSFIFKQETSVRNWIKRVASQPNTLLSTCVFKIRKCLGHGIKSNVSKLNLPNVIQDVILLKGILLSVQCFM